MHSFGRTFIFVLFPLIGNFLLAVSAFFIKPGDFHDLEVCYLTIFTALIGSVISFMGLKIHDLDPKRMVLALIAQSVTLIFIFAGIYRGYGLLYGGEHVDLINDGRSALYFSVVTWTTLGYGDFSPPLELRLIAALQALLGYAFFGVSVGLVTAILCERNTSAKQR
jgi:hypothetical protein